MGKGGPDRPQKLSTRAQIEKDRLERCSLVPRELTSEDLNSVGLSFNKWADDLVGELATRFRPQQTTDAKV